MDEGKTIGDMLVEASRSGGKDAIREAMKAFWGAAKEVGLPTPDTHPPEFLKSEKNSKGE